MSKSQILEDFEHIDVSLRELFRLRSLPSLRGRLVRARVFRRHELFGLLDYSGALWPVKLNGMSQKVSLWSRLECLQSKPQMSGEVIQFDMRHEERFCAEPNSALIAQMESWLESESVFCSMNGNLEKSSETQFIESVPFPEISQHQVFQRAKALVRRFFASRGYFEVDSPVLVQSGGFERYLGIFETTYTDMQHVHKKYQLPTSPEFALKKCLAKGYPRIFSISSSFRNNGELSRWHRPEFSMLEWYTAGQTIDQLITQTMDLIRMLIDEMGFPRWIDQCGVPTLRIEDLFLEYFDLDLKWYLQGDRRIEFFEALRKKSISVNNTDSVDDLFWKSFLDVIEPAVLAHKGAIILTGFPLGYASLANPAPDGIFAERFELFIDGVEICNGYHELTDAQLAKERFLSLENQREGLSRDRDFEDALECGIGRCSGNALGLERLLSCLSGHPGLAFGTGLQPFGDANT